MTKRAESADLIELDLNRYELRRAGRRIRIERIPMELLILLAQSGGRLLSRDEIIEHLWGKNPWLDAERNLNTAVGKLRQALGDSADKPRYVETVVGKGYRFIAPHRNGYGNDQSPDNGGTRFELIGAPVGKEPEQSAHEGTVTAAHQNSPAAVSVSQPDLVSKPGPEVSLTHPAGRRRLGRLARFLVAFGVVLVIAMITMFFWPQPQQQEIPHYDQITNNDLQMDFTLGEYPLPILTDSLRLYFSVYSGTGDLAIGQVAAGGGQSGLVNTTLKSPVALGISPDGASLLVASPAVLPQAPLWVQPIPDGQPRRLGQVEARSGSWSPYGNRIAYSTTNGLFTVRSDGTDVRQLVSISPDTGKQIYWPRWSSNAKILRYSVYDPQTGNHSLWQVNADGTDSHRFLPDWKPSASECCGSWTPDGQYFVFAATQNGRSDIWAMPERIGLFSRASRQAFQLTAGPISFTSPLPARDGDIFAAGTATRGELARWDPNSRTLTPWFGGASVLGVSSSPDGKWITYTSFPDRTLWRSRVDGSDKLQLTLSPLEAYLPRWSPDGSQIAFYARMPEKPFQVYIVPAGGGTPQRPIPSDRQQIDPTWARNGRELMFESDPWQARGNGRKTQIEIVDLQNGKSSVLSGSTGLVSPRWSPDGLSVAAMPADSSGLMLFDLRTQRWSQLLRGHIGYPNWSHDGRYIYFDWFSSPAGVCRIRLADRRVQTVLSRQAQDALSTADDWTGLTADDSVLLLRNVSIQEIYAIRWRSSRE